MSTFLLTFILLSIINVVFATFRSLATIKGTKLVASLMSGGYYAFYNIMLIYTVSDFPIWQKCLITFICNVIGVYFVKWIEEISQKDKLWKIEATVPAENCKTMTEKLDMKKMSFNSQPVFNKNYFIFNIYCRNKEQSRIAKDILIENEAKFFVSESKNL